MCRSPRSRRLALFLYRRTHLGVPDRSGDCLKGGACARRTPSRCLRGNRTLQWLPPFHSPVLLRCPAPDLRLFTGALPLSYKACQLFRSGRRRGWIDFHPGSPRPGGRQVFFVAGAGLEPASRARRQTDPGRTFRCGASPGRLPCSHSFSVRFSKPVPAGTRPTARGFIGAPSPLSWICATAKNGELTPAGHEPSVSSFAVQRRLPGIEPGAVAGTISPAGFLVQPFDEHHVYGVRKNSHRFRARPDLQPRRSRPLLLVPCARRRARRLR